MPETKPTIAQKAGTAIKAGAQKTGNYISEVAEGKRNINPKNVLILAGIGIGVYFGGRYLIRRGKDNKTTKEALDNPASQLAQRAKGAMGHGWDGTNETALHDVFREAKEMGYKMEDIDKAYFAMYQQRLADAVESEVGPGMYQSLVDIYKLGLEKDKSGKVIIPSKAKVQVTTGDWLVCNTATGAFIRKTPVKTSKSWTYAEGAVESVTNAALWPVSLIKGAFTGDYNIVDHNFSNIINVVSEGTIIGRFTGKYYLDTTSGETVMFYEATPYYIPRHIILAAKSRDKAGKEKFLETAGDPNAAAALGMKFLKPIWVAASAVRALYNDSEKNPNVKGLIKNYPKADKNKNGKIDNFPVALLLTEINNVFSYTDSQYTGAENTAYSSSKVVTLGGPLKGLGALNSNVWTKYSTVVFDKSVRVIVDKGVLLGTKIAEIPLKNKRKLIQFRSPLGQTWYVKADVVNIL